MVAILSPTAQAQDPRPSEEPPAARLPKSPSPIKALGLRIPEAAIKANVGGKAYLKIKLEADGKVSGVEVLREDPSGYGFGEAASASLPLWTFPPNNAGVYALTVTFRIEPGVQYKKLEFSDLPLAPERLSGSAPVYPERAFRTGLEGKAVFELRLGDEGQVAKAILVRSLTTDRQFGNAAAKVIKNWRYPEVLRNNVYQLHIEFTKEAVDQGLIRSPE